MAGNFWFALLLCALAGLSTGIGSLFFLLSQGGRKFLASALGFAAGVMIYVSFVEIFFKARQNLIAEQGGAIGSVATVASFFGGILFTILINLLFSLVQKRKTRQKNKQKTSLSDSATLNLEPASGEAPKKTQKIVESGLLKSGLLTAIAMTIHNFPEGMTTFISAFYDPAFAITVVIAIAIHNIPEGIAVSVPIYYATKSKTRAFLASVATGLAEILGGLFGYLLLSSISLSLYGVLFAAVAGMMVWISVDELLPSAREYDKKFSMIGFAFGMVVIAASLLLLQ